MNDCHDFIIDVENTAKRILKQSNKKQLEATRQDQLRQARLDKKTKKKQSDKGHGTMNIADIYSNDKVTLERTFGTSTAGMKPLVDTAMAKTRVLDYSVPRMAISLGADTVNLDGNKSLDSGSTPLKPGNLSPIRKRPSSSSGKAVRTQALEEEKQLRRSKILEKLKDSPFQPSPTTLALEKMNSKKAALTSKSTPNLKQETDWALRMHASNVLSGKGSSSNANKIFLKSQAAANVPTGVVKEAQGPIDWSSRGLREKYRNEDARELAWSTYMDAISYADNTAFEEDKQLIPVAVVERHPVMRMFFDRLTEENLLSRQRTLARLRMKRFVQNVQEVWLTNLAHLREHQVENMFGATGSSSSAGGSRSGSGTNSEGSIGIGVPGGTGGGGVPRGKGLRDRRDVRAIKDMSSQIQSVSHTRALKSSFYTTRMPEPSVRLDYVAEPCPKHDVSALLPPPPFHQRLLLQRTDLSTTESSWPFVVCIDRLVPPFASSPSPRPTGTGDATPSTEDGTPVPTLQSHQASTFTASSASNVMWRVNLVRTNEELLVKTYLIPEKDVEYFISDLAEKWQELHGDDADTVSQTSNGNEELIYEIEEADIAWGNGIELNSSVRVYIRDVGARSLNSLSPVSHRDNSVEMVIHVELRDDYEGVQVHPLTINSIELCSLLGVQETPSIAISIKEWFRESVSADSASHYIWERLAFQLHFTEGDEDAGTGDPLPTTLGLHPHEVDTAASYQAGQNDSSVNEFGQNKILNSNVLPSAKAIQMAYTLLSLLQVSDELELSVADLLLPDGITMTTDEDEAGAEKSSKVLDVAYLPFKYIEDNHSFEELADVVNSLSLRVSGGEQLLSQIPGASAVGSMGLWYTYPLHKERTQASAIFYRNPQVSSTDTVLVNLTLALDTSVLSLPSLAWEGHPENPPATIHNPADGVVPMISPFPKTLTATPVKTIYDSLTTPVVHIFSTTPIEGMDYPELEPLWTKRKKAPKGFYRHVPLRSKDGFRHQVTENLLATDPVLPTIVFGVTRMGAMPNAPAVHTRSVWHSIITINESINRVRGAQDYHYVLANDLSHGPNDPACFTIRFFGYGSKELFRADILCSAFQMMEAQYKEIQVERDRFARENSLEAKIESSEVYLRTKQKQYEILIRKRTQLAIEKKMRKVSKSELGWRRRLEFSVVLETQGDWEQRLDQRAGTCFFHRITEDGPEFEALVDTCQWEVPPTWNGDPLAAAVEGEHKTDVKGSTNMDMTPGEGAFNQPEEVWMPHLELGEMSHFSDDKTPGTKSTTLKRPGQDKGDKRVGTARGSLTSRSSRISPSKESSQPTHAAGSGASGPGAAEELLLNDDLVYALARRLGLPTDSIVPASQLPSVFTANTSMDKSRSFAKGSVSFDPFSSFQSSTDEGSGEGLLAPRLPSDIPAVRDAEDPEFDSDDDLWSDDERLVGDMEDDDVGAFLPASHADVKRYKKEQAELLGNAGIDKETKKPDTAARSGDKVPYLNLQDRIGVGEPHENNKSVMAWRKLPRPEIPAKFFQRCTQTNTLGPDSGSVSNKPNTPVFLVPLSPVDACQYEPMTFSVDVESIFIPDAKQDMDRVLANIERNIAREEELSKTVATDDVLLFGGNNTEGMTSVDNFVAKQYRQDKEAFRDPKQEAVEKALLAAKTTNLAEMEDALEEDISIDTADQFGNTLLILAAQQGSKRMCKYLLRRGANINVQTLAGHTALHYCYAYSHFELAEYLKSRGANDAILNGENLTCYEGLSASGVAAIV
mmetsp:Transcript_21478/g.31157  ORF Transcript_21478/g.31157 Transcript_21478/m.31157 type:complete len:1761 (-) Transcript_21478:200-5482(-)|eukprot:CAMPEP_0185022394 /NCGR_PEP_ID=MMETSP1103-20130426/5116_1 /TAXON_ID=36769 /ORGANISM="Paraphysomonas bandaiensis, Strain Caron Lab Isolate" /LENGTH=1760 /DNA_ID=CAMNT_0027554451 /DNA_START=14 /DNA_END=5296 /DNA_ORIENTATION=+